MPEVLSKEEVKSILDAVDNIKHKAILMLVYSAGLFLPEIVTPMELVGGGEEDV